MIKALEIVTASAICAAAMFTPIEANAQATKGTTDTSVSSITYNVGSSRLNRVFYENNDVGFTRYFRGGEGRTVCSVAESSPESKGPLDVAVFSPYTLKDCQKLIADGYNTIFWGEVLSYVATSEKFNPLREKAKNPEVYVNLKIDNTECRAESMPSQNGPGVAYSIEVNLINQSKEPLPGDSNPCYDPTAKAGSINARLNQFALNVAEIVETNRKQTEGWPALMKVNPVEFPELLGFFGKIKRDYDALIRGR